LALARTSRFAIVASDTRQARAISAVLRPASVRSVSATRASSDSAGWQQVNSSRSRSSAIPLAPLSPSGSPARLPASSPAAAQHRLGLVAVGGRAPDTGTGDPHGAEAEAVDRQVTADIDRAGHAGVHGRPLRHRP
jgi:hypothetical protein